MLPGVKILSSRVPKGDHGCAGAPTPKAVRELASEVQSASTEDGGGVVIDLRPPTVEDEDLIEAILKLRQPQIRWIVGEAETPKPCLPVVLVTSGVRAYVGSPDLVARRGGPSLWFALGFELLDGSGLRSAEGLEEAGEVAVRRLMNHPLVAMHQRAEELFDRHDVDPDSNGYPSFELAGWMAQARRSGIGIVCPGTYQIEGGLSVPLPRELTRLVVEHVVIGLAGDQGCPTTDCGYTKLGGSGWWFSDRSHQAVEEPVELVVIHAKVDRQMASSVARYLRWAWLQDEVFVTLDGAAVTAGE